MERSAFILGALVLSLTAPLAFAGEHGASPLSTASHGKPAAALCHAQGRQVELFRHLLETIHPDYLREDFCFVAMMTKGRE